MFCDFALTDSYIPNAQLDILSPIRDIGSPIGHLRSPISNNNPNWGYFLLVLYFFTFSLGSLVKLFVLGEFFRCCLATSCIIQPNSWIPTCNNDSFNTTKCIRNQMFDTLLSIDIYKPLKETSLLCRLQAQTLPDATPPIGQIHPFIKMAITFEPLKRFWCPLGFRKFLIIMK